MDGTHQRSCQLVDKNGNGNAIMATFLKRRYQIWQIAVENLAQFVLESKLLRE